MFNTTPAAPVEVSPDFHNPAWLEKAIIYEIYPQTFYDTNGDGIGDLPGVIAKLDYVKSLGADTIWLNPCFESPFGDAGYDISDFYKVAPRYGTNADLRRLFEEAHQRGLRVLLDLVAGHTSVECEWFKQSARHERNAYSDWYIWTNDLWSHRNPTIRHQFIAGMYERMGGYLPNFFPFQPALNYGFANPDPDQPWQQAVDAPGPQAVRAEMRKIMRYWLDMGADGFRVDMAASLVKDDPGSRATIQFWREIRTWLDQDYPEAVLVAEWGRPDRALKAGFHIDFYMANNGSGYASLFRKNGRGWGTDPYGSSFFDTAGTGNIREFTDDFTRRFQATHRAGYMCVYSGNHDTSPRLGHNRSFEDLKVAFACLFSLPGVPKIYYGDEIGMIGVQGLPSKEGSYLRTEARTPMQWAPSANAGFSSAPAAALYLPVEPDPGTRTVTAQDADPDSLLNTIRELARLRRAHPALYNPSDFQVIYAEARAYPFVFLRQSANERIVVVLNPSSRPVEVLLSGERLAAGGTPPQTLWGHVDGLQLTPQGWRISLPGVSAGIYQI